jgi:hypothetical protein
MHEFSLKAERGRKSKQKKSLKRRKKKKSTAKKQKDTKSLFISNHLSC